MPQSPAANAPADADTRRTLPGADPSDTAAGPTAPIAPMVPAAEPPHPSTHDAVLLQAPVDVRNLSLAVLAVLGSVFMLHWARDVFIPLMLGLTSSYALTPLVNRMQRLHLPRAAAAGLLLLAIVGGLGWTVYALKDDATSFIEGLPDAAEKVRRTMSADRQRNKPESALDKVQKAATQLEQAAQESASPTPAPARGVTRVQIERPGFNLKNYLLSVMPTLAVGVGQFTIVLFITFFLLTAGDSFRRKLVRLAGPTLTQRRITVQALDQISAQIQRYLLAQVLVSLLVGLATWAAYAVIGVAHAAVWGAMACVLNFVPYIGSLLVIGGSAFVGYVQFGSVDMALLVAGTSLLVHIVSGNLLTPWLTSRTSRMNAVAVFVGVLAFGWLWGVWGLLLGVPTLLMVKAVCDRVDGLKPIGELLGT